MDDELPKIIRIMPDYGPCYASDEDYGMIDVADCFNDHPDIEEIREIEKQLYGLANWIDKAEVDNAPDFPWDELDEKGLALTNRLSRILSNTGIPVVYDVHYNNPKHPSCSI